MIWLSIGKRSGMLFQVQGSISALFPRYGGAAMMPASRTSSFPARLAGAEQQKFVVAPECSTLVVADHMGARGSIKTQTPGRTCPNQISNRIGAGAANQRPGGWRAGCPIIVVCGRPIPSLWQTNFKTGSDCPPGRPKSGCVPDGLLRWSLAIASPAPLCFPNASPSGPPPPPVRVEALEKMFSLLG